MTTIENHKTMKTRPTIKQLCFGLLTFACCLSAVAQGTTAFTYQGRLNDGASQATGLYDLRFAVFDAATAGTELGSTLTNATTPLSNGLFTVTLDFGTGIFTGPARWLEIAVRTNGAGGFFTLSPRQALTPAPYAITAGNVISGGLAAGTYGNAVTLNNAANQFSGSFAGNGANVTNVNAASLGGLASSNFWQSGGNNVAAGKFLGSTNNQPVEIRANNLKAMQFAYASNAVSGYSPNLIGGHTANYARSGVVGATIGGGGNTGVFGTNAVLADFGTVLGGQGNTASGKYSTAGGLLSAANGQYATAFGGVSTAGADFATAMGQSTASGTNSTAMGQSSATQNNATAMGNSSATNFAATAMGSSTAGGYGATALGSSLANGWRSSALGYSTALGSYSTALGASSTASGANASTAMGASQAVDPYCTAMGSSHAGGNGLGSGAYATATGSNCWATGLASIAMGYDTDANGFGAIAMGIGTKASGEGSFAMGGGYFHNPPFTIASGDYSIAMGTATTASGNYSVAIGSSCSASGNYAFAGGTEAQAVHAGSFVWCDSLAQTGSSQGVNTFTVRASGGIYLFTSGGATGVQVGAGGGSWSSISDRNAKENFQPVNAQDVLARVAALPLTSWNYKTQEKTIRHLGPMAQDFYAAFNVGEDEKHITTVDADGVALAAIQGLNQNLEETRTELKRRDAEIAELRARLERLEKILSPPTDR